MRTNGAKWLVAMAVGCVGLFGCSDETGAETSTTSESGSGATTDDGSGSSGDGPGSSGGQGTTGQESSGDVDEADPAVMWEATLTAADWSTALEVAASPSGRIYVLVEDRESGPALFALSPAGETLWTYELGDEDVERADLVATEDHVAVGIVTSIGTLGYAYRYTVINQDGSLHSTENGATRSRSIGLALAGENLILSGAGTATLAEGTAEIATVSAYRLGTPEPAWTWRRPESEGASSGDSVVILPDGGIAVAGRSADPGRVELDHSWVGRISANGQTDWDVHLDLDASVVTVSVGSDQNLYVTGGETSLVVGSNSEPINALALTTTQWAGSFARLSWSDTGFLVGGRRPDADTAVTGYSSSGDTLWQYDEPRLDRTRASFVDNTSFVHAGPAADSDAVLVQRIDTNLL